MDPIPSSHQVSCSLHDWGGLRSQLIFIYDRPNLNGASNGSFVRHNEISAWLIRRGWARLEADGQSRIARPGQWLICTGAKIRQELSHDLHLLSLRLHHDWPDGHPILDGGPLTLFEAKGHEALEETAKSLKKVFGRIDFQNHERSYAFLRQTRVDYRTYLRQQGLLFQWLEILSDILVSQGWQLRIPAGIDARLAAALHSIDSQNPGELFPAKEASYAGGLTLGQLNRLSKATLGMTLHEYRDQRRLEWAKTALAQERAHIKTVASSLGFTQLSHFSAWFKRHTGLAPRAYSKQRE